MITCIIHIYLLLTPINQDVKYVVAEYHQLTTEQAEINFINKHSQNSDPSVAAYVLSISMKQAEYTYNPYEKIRIFKFNEKMLNQLINQNQSNVHLRYVRLIAQENAPRFLGYNNHLEEDKYFLNKILLASDESDYLDAYIRANTSL